MNISQNATRALSDWLHKNIPMRWEENFITTHVNELSSEFEMGLSNEEELAKYVTVFIGRYLAENKLHKDVQGAVFVDHGYMDLIEFMRDFGHTHGIRAPLTIYLLKRSLCKLPEDREIYSFPCINERFNIDSFEVRKRRFAVRDQDAIKHNEEFACSTIFETFNTSSE